MLFQALLKDDLPFPYSFQTGKRMARGARGAAQVAQMIPRVMTLVTVQKAENQAVLGSLALFGVPVSTKGFSLIK